MINKLIYSENTKVTFYVLDYNPASKIITGINLSKLHPSPHWEHYINPAKFKEVQPIIFAVDFDGTLCKNKYPEIGEANNKLIDDLKLHKIYGNKLILWTCREGKHLQEAINWCEKHHLYFDAVNANLQEQIDIFNNDSRKIGADFYIDDKAIAVRC